MIIVQGIASGTNVDLASKYGIFPREAIGLRGIFLAPFLHFGWNHLTSNLPFVFILGLFVALRGVWAYSLVFGITAVFGGFFVWLVAGSKTVHAGASGLLMGFLGHLMVVALVERKLWSICLYL